MKQYETVIGLEVHVELATKTKIFCGCSTEFGGAPNTHTCPVCTGMPGSLPVLNKKVVEFALKAGLAANCQIHQYCKFDRKNYFYPDNPQNYQISQLYLPICHDGWVEIETSAGKKKIRIHEMHMEEDAGKLIHDEWEDCSLVDYNRSGVPLIEIVSEPDMRSSEEVIAYLEKLRCMMQYLGVSDCKLQEGSMRADVNLSVREVGAEEFGTRTEMKNLNSFKAIARAIEGERERQIELIEEGKAVTQETRRWDDNKEYSYAMRSKEDAKDYRYFPDPDLPPIHISDAWIEKIKAEQPELREVKQARYQEEYGLPAYDAGILTESRHLAGLFEETAAIYGNAKKTANWLIFFNRSCKIWMYKLIIKMKIRKDKKGADRLKKPEKGKKKKIIGYNYLGMVGIAVIALVLLGSLMVQSKGLQQRLDYYNSKAAALEKSIDSEKERTKEIEAQKEYMKTDEYVEEAAREKLGLVKDNEIVFQEEK